MFSLSRQGAVDVITAGGPFTVEQIENASETFRVCLSRGQPSAVFDLRGVPLMDSAALEVLLDVQESFNRLGGVLKLAAPEALCRDILRVSGVGTRFEMFDEINSAIGSFAK